MPRTTLFSIRRHVAVLCTTGQERGEKCCLDFSRGLHVLHARIQVFCLSCIIPYTREINAIMRTERALDQRAREKQKRERWREKNTLHRHKESYQVSSSTHTFVCSTPNSVSFSYLSQLYCCLICFVYGYLFIGGMKQTRHWIVNTNQIHENESHYRKSRKKCNENCKIDLLAKLKIYLTFFKDARNFFFRLKFKKMSFYFKKWVWFRIIIMASYFHE